MVDELREVMEAAAGRGTEVGAEEVVARAYAEVAPPGRRTIRVVIGLTTAAAVLVAAVVGGGIWYGRVKLDDIDRVDLATDLLGTAKPTEPMNVLLVGSDSRTDLAEEEAVRFGTTGEVGGARADSIMVLHLDPAAGTALVLSLPRDLWVPIDGGPSQRINTALIGGPGALVRTVQDALGIAVDHYVQFDFNGFRKIVDAVGGVDVHFDTPVRDRVTGLDVREAGCRELDGDAALALVRSRHYQYFADGAWHSDPTGDLGRVARQQAFLVSVLGDSAAARNPLTIARLLDAAADDVSVDDGMSTDDLLDLVRRVGDLPAGHVRFLSFPIRNTHVGSAAVLVALPSELRGVGAMLIGPLPSPTTGAGPSSGMRTYRFSYAPEVTLPVTCDK